MSVSRFADLVGQLAELIPESAPQGRLFQMAGAETTRTAADIVRASHELEVRLRTMRGGSSIDHLPDTSPQREMVIGRQLKRVLRTLGTFAAAYAWNYMGVRRQSSQVLREPTPRLRTVLFADIAGSTPQAATLPHEQNARWKNDGLNLIAQWGNAFGGQEITDVYPRKGDDICIEFADPDNAVLCGAMVQEHACALRSTGSPALAYRFRVAVDAYWLNEADGGNTISFCIDRAAKLAKQDKGLTDPIWITPEVSNDCSEEIRNSLSLHSEEIDLGADTARARFTPSLLDRARLLSAYIERLSG